MTEIEQKNNTISQVEKLAEKDDNEGKAEGEISRRVSFHN